MQNVDKVQKELQRLRLAVKMWTLRAVTSMFGSGASGAAAGNGGDGGVSDGAGEGGSSASALLLPASTSVEALEREAAALLSRPDVAEFVSAVNHTISEKTASVHAHAASRKVRLSMGAVLSPSPMRSNRPAHALYSPVRPIRPNPMSQYRNEELDVYSPPCSFPGVNGGYMGNAGRESILANFPSLAAGGGGGLLSAQPEETEKLLARMFDVSIC